METVSWIFLGLIAMGVAAFFMFGFKDPRAHGRPTAEGGNDIGTWSGGGDGYHGGGGADGGGGGGGDGGAS